LISAGNRKGKGKGRRGENGRGWTKGGKEREDENGRKTSPLPLRH